LDDGLSQNSNSRTHKTRGSRIHPPVFLFNKLLPRLKVFIDGQLTIFTEPPFSPGCGVSVLKYLRMKILELLIWLAHRIGGKNNLHLRPCPVCSGQSFMIDSYLCFRLDCFSNSSPAALRLDVDISDAVVICRQCHEELEINDAANELIKLIVSTTTAWSE
jgi:hypothetical protein